VETENTNRQIPAGDRKSQLDDGLGVNLLNFVPKGKIYLKNEDESFVEQKIFYRMSLTRSLRCIGKCPKKKKKFRTVYYTPHSLHTDFFK